jgi:hypothetical protein
VPQELYLIVVASILCRYRLAVKIENPKDRYWQMYREFQPAAGKDFAYIKHLLSPTDPNPEEEFYDLNLTMDPYQLNSKPDDMVTEDMRSKLRRLTTLKGANLRTVEVEARGRSSTPSTTAAQAATRTQRI